ncbi:hypothetical protein B0H11DRAFT_2213849 [Mycena galericulata]|nr:hypothetical protein B0H11DRAFT_2213849 [Mycena galericulata]
MALGIPTSSSTVTVKVFDIMEDPGKVIGPAAFLYTPILPGHETLRAPDFAFLVENVATKKRVMFDLGPRKDVENAAPQVAELAKAGNMALPVSRDIIEQLTDGGVALDSIDAVVWSHVHFDHTGDMSKFPTSTDLVFGRETVLESYVTNLKSTLLESDFTGRKLTPIDFEKSTLEFGGFKAHDYFGDGSFYLLDVPGHLSGHVCGLARVTPTSFVLMGADAGHHAGVLRPTEHLHRNFPCPGELLAATRRSISTKYFPPPDSAGEFDLKSRTTPLLDVSENGFEDPPTARASLNKLGQFDADPNVFVVLAHDESLIPVVGPFPTLLDEWQAKGWKELVTWAFVDEKNAAFRFNVKAA